MTRQYHSIHEHYDRIFPLNPLLVSFLARYFTPGTRMLDIGCGTGTAAHALTCRGAVVTGIDISTDMIRLAEKKYPGERFLATDIDSLANGDFGLIYSIGNTISYFDPASLERLIRAIRKRLQPDGHWVTQTVNWDFHTKHAEFRFKPKSFDGGVFHRRYNLHNDNTVDFEIRVEWNDGSESMETHRLHRLVHDRYRDIHRKHGFKETECHLSWAGDAWSPEADGATICVFQRVAGG